MADAKLHVVILSSPGMGHLIPVILLGNRLVDHPNVDVTIVVVTTRTSPAESHLLKDSNIPMIEIVAPPEIIAGKLEPGAKILRRITVIMRETLPAIRSTLSAMNPRPDVLIGDLFSMDAWPIADELQIPKYVFVTCSAWFVSLMAYSPVLDQEVSGQYVDRKEPLVIPGCRPVPPENIGDSMLDRYSKEYEEYLRRGVGFSASDGILINTWEVLECKTLHALMSNELLRRVMKASVYPVGPLYRADEQENEKDEVIIRWLDNQPEESVLFVSFGSGGTMSAEQITELAFGLERSGQRFVWVVRPPPAVVGATSGVFFTAGNSNVTPSDYLPKGFLTRIAKTGLVAPGWAPQVPILKHPSVGGFLTHCGWNSTLESIGNGVPMIAWPLYAEQRLNAAMLTEELVVALRPEVLPTKKVVGRDEIESMVRRLMEDEEGKEMRKKVKELKKSGEEALRVDDGSSYNSTCDFINDCWIKIKPARNPVQ